VRGLARVYEMGLAPGGRMRQEIFKDRRPMEHWDLTQSSRCFVHLANSASWKQITGDAPPATPVDVHAYRRAGLPWFDYYDERQTAVEGSGILRKLKSIVDFGKVREGTF